MENLKSPKPMMCPLAEPMVLSPVPMGDLPTPTSTIVLKDLFILFYVHECFACMCCCTPHA